MKNQDGIIRVGGVGTGRIFNYAHLYPYPRLWAKARLVGFFDTSPAAATKAMENYRGVLTEYAEKHPEAAEAVRANLAELRVHDSLPSLLGQADAIDVCTHSRGRMAAALAALEAGVHSMVEKPMARTWIEADRAVRAFAERGDVLFQLNDDNVFDTKYRVLADLLAGGAIGSPQSITLIRGSNVSSQAILKSQASALENGGGCLLDYGTHGLAGVWSLLGARFRPRKVEAVRIAVDFPHRVLQGDPIVMEVDDNARIKVLFEDPESGSWVTVFMEATWSGSHIGLHPEKNGRQSGGWVRIVGDEGVIETATLEQVEVTRWDGGRTVVPIHVPEGMRDSFKAEVEAFVEAVSAGRTPETGVEFGAGIIAIVGSAYLSAIRKRAVTIEEFEQFSRGYVEKHGDNEQAEEAILADLLAPYKSKT